MSKYEAVMKTEPNVLHFLLLAKERICHSLVQVRVLTAALRCMNALCLSKRPFVILMFALKCSGSKYWLLCAACGLRQGAFCVVTRASRVAEPSRCAAKS